MKGMEMLLQSFGLDPEKLKAEIGTVANGLRGEVQKLHARIDDVEKTCSRIEEKLDTILTLQQEVTAWKRIHNPQVILNPQPQPPLVPQPPNQ